MSIQIRNLERVQKCAYYLMQEDARFLYSLVDISKNTDNLDSNYICMSMPYIGLFADGAEQWCKKVGLAVPSFTQEEKEYYVHLRSSIKSFEQGYAEYLDSIKLHLYKSDEHFKNIRFGRLLYYNVGTDIFLGSFCGNTILCSSYIPYDCFEKSIGVQLKNISVVAGKIAAALGCNKFEPYKHVDEKSSYRDYHFYNNSPLRMNNDIGLVLFCVLCSINYVTTFIEKYYSDEIPQKLKFAYLQYYYLCDFLSQIEKYTNIKIEIDVSLKNREFRNCLAHYGLGTYMKEMDLVQGDMLVGLTNKAFGMDYYETKRKINGILENITRQIENMILM